ncbi:DUF6250 domain-containing protein [Cellulophaga baltica]|uniref:DUF6250 domain-containing protein n=1 Tax=Cellulophaga baltica TaxID=76594 RepID=UPI0004060047|nr:DUF6250 domain-containing protein [Cellulophaga baltica]
MNFERSIGHFAGYSVLLFSLFVLSACNSKIKLNDTQTVDVTLLHTESFDENLNNWKVEQMPGGTVQIVNKKLEIYDAAGCTIWYTQKLEGSIMITYDATVIDNGELHDRVSDLNCFWMATDLENPTNLFENSARRGGKFSNYDSLQLYYMGVGGHNNTKTRFRRYLGNGERPLLPEHDLTASKFLLKANTTYKIKIIAHEGIIQYYKDDLLIADFQDSQPYTSGYFGLRTVDNHMTVDEFKVYRLSPAN